MIYIFQILQLLIIAGLIGVVWFFVKVWLKGLSIVMATEDDQFPGKNDKILWVVLFLFVPFFAPYIYARSVERYNHQKSK